MGKNNDFTQSLKDIKNVEDNVSWFRDTPHRWAAASLPLAYAMACVEVVSKKSEKAGAIYHQIVEDWGKPGLQSLFEAIISEIPDPEMEKVKEALLHPESELLPDPNKRFKDLEEILTGIEINDDVSEDDADTEQLSPEDQQAVEDMAAFVGLVSEFIIVGFNRESDVEKGRYRVVLDEKAPWLIWAVLLPTCLEHYNVTLEKLRILYKLRKYKGKIIDFHKVLTEEPMSRWHRKIVADGKAVKLKLKNDRVIIEAARHWYKCRVVYSSINKYCDDPLNKNVFLDPKNVTKQIRPCDDALGYIRRLPKKKPK